MQSTTQLVFGKHTWESIALYTSNENSTVNKNSKPRLHICFLIKTHKNRSFVSNVIMSSLVTFFALTHMMGLDSYHIPSCKTRYDTGSAGHTFGKWFHNVNTSTFVNNYIIFDIQTSGEAHVILSPTKTCDPDNTNQHCWEILFDNGYNGIGNFNDIVIRRRRSWNSVIGHDYYAEIAGYDLNINQNETFWIKWNEAGDRISIGITPYISFDTQIVSFYSKEFNIISNYLELTCWKNRAIYYLYTDCPTVTPTTNPTKIPSNAPSKTPTNTPSMVPTDTPTINMAKNMDENGTNITRKRTKYWLIPLIVFLTVIILCILIWFMVRYWIKSKVAIQVKHKVNLPAIQDSNHTKVKSVSSDINLDTLSNTDDIIMDDGNIPANIDGAITVGYKNSIDKRNDDYIEGAMQKVSYFIDRNNSTASSQNPIPMDGFNPDIVTKR